MSVPIVYYIDARSPGPCARRRLPRFLLGSQPILITRKRVR
jgi:hypothetical protein